MDLAEVKKRLEVSAKSSREFWEQVKQRFTSEEAEIQSNFRVLDIQNISDDCIDLIMIRKWEDENESMDHWRFIIEKPFLRKPKLRLYITSGPSLDEFMAK
ncbi:MAG: hypothetical protein CMP91_07415 [Gammaproteobacteria bacterium]|nr:hypothetical protein [Gammaproteobacteria bacterium]|tara:strand:+ start:396382 stop:396684 length:303 start_codon:yes stop_codon:yes gene_type:complete